MSLSPWPYFSFIRFNMLIIIAQVLKEKKEKINISGKREKENASVKIVVNKPS